MAWVAFDRAIRLADEHHTLPAGRVGRWTRLRDRIHAEVTAANLTMPTGSSQMRTARLSGSPAAGPLAG